jgi:lipoprotein-releasing system permease protein
MAADAVSPPRAFSAIERMLAFRYLRARGKDSFISVIAIFSFIGVMLGVATLIIVMSVMNGFRKELVSKLLGLNGHVLIQPLESPLTDYKDVVERIACRFIGRAGARHGGRRSRESAWRGE